MSEIDKADVLIEALGVAAFTFETYEKLHSAKRTPEGYDKARKNAQMAARCLDAISAYRQASPHPIARAGLDVGREAGSYAEWQQRRGRARDLIDWAISEYDGWMLDDHYDAREPLDRIVNRLRQFRDDERVAAAAIRQIKGHTHE